mmetsp:Transcript_31567/g.53292  ORF Transcript_31567/g.53292 Transcript_31567/m.53292 type:complete len:387 (-) Transcript_31567:432-1592(-)|eukprot:CAMPEP_0184673786 /NCGR_PEP_ID=MMETSP0308-20130426/86875_1 /TAXON_ID=38269 /ORGANISM="Gloeochaete witrockiana, Strain SAG 46.84" /LENGTH=386 /DNA_ID=CAMNT_0027121313 /DNA_START=60 /DNA_END=1220 /DNA_ORIENTATION=+
MPEESKLQPDHGTKPKGRMASANFAAETAHAVDDWLGDKHSSAVSDHESAFASMSSVYAYSRFVREKIQLTKEESLHAPTLIKTPEIAAEVKLTTKEEKFSLKYGSNIHHGIYTDVYKGSFNGQKVAIKELDLTRADPVTAARGINEYMEEGYLLSELHHPNIVKLLHADLTSPTKRILVLEWVEGHDLYVHLHTVGTRFRTIRQVLSIASTLASTYTYMHSLNIVNRDIKSLNIMIDADHDNKITVIDFGNARKLDEGRPMTPRTGSYRWAAPENLRGEDYGKEADVYSFGVIMWEIISGELPFDGYSPEQAGELVAVQRVRPGTFMAGPNCTPELRDILQRTWDENPSVRPTMAELDVQLKKMLDQLPAVVEDNGMCGSTCKVS